MTRLVNALGGDTMIRTFAAGLALMVLGACETLPQPFTFHSDGSAAATSAAASSGAAPAAASSGPTQLAVAYTPTAQEQLLDLERQLAAKAQDHGLGGSLSTAVDPNDGFVVKPGQVLQGPDQVAHGLDQAGTGPIMWQPDRVFVSQSGDMGMTSGRYVQVIPGAEAAQGRYVSVWRKDESGQWRLLSQTRTPDPPRAAAHRRH